MIPEDWIAVTRVGDKETLGYLEFDGENFLPYDLLGLRRAEDALPYLEAEEIILNLGLGYLAWRHELVWAGQKFAVAIAEINPSRVVLVCDDDTASQTIGTKYELPLPVDAVIFRLGTPGSSPRFIQAIRG